MQWWENFTSGIQNLAQGAPSIIDAFNPPKAAKPAVVEAKTDYTPLMIIGGIFAALIVVVLLFKR